VARLTDGLVQSGNDEGGPENTVNNPGADLSRVRLHRADDRAEGVRRHVRLHLVRRQFRGIFTEHLGRSPATGGPGSRRPTSSKQGRTTAVREVRNGHRTTASAITQETASPTRWSTLCTRRAGLMSIGGAFAGARKLDEKPMAAIAALANVAGFVRAEEYDVCETHAEGA